MAKSARILKENVDPSDIFLGNLTTDCYFVYQADGQIDVVRAQKMADIFDVYHDRGITLRKISISGGTKNPRTSEPEV
jgi:hypothetical protein